MQAIRTRYFGVTDVKGSRIQAKAEACSIYVSYDHALDLDENHRAACWALCEKLGWITYRHAPMYGGVFDHDYYWVIANSETRLDVPARAEEGANHAQTL
jgi:hypothetical protein